MILPGIGNASYTFLLALSILGGAAVPQVRLALVLFRIILD